MTIQDAVFGKEEAEKTTKWKPRVIQGGKEPPEPPTNNWLKGLKLGDRVLVRPRSWQHQTELLECRVFEKSEQATKLMIYFPQQAIVSWEDNLRFSKVFELVEVINKKRRFEDFMNGKSNRTI